MQPKTCAPEFLDLTHYTQNHSSMSQEDEECLAEEVPTGFGYTSVLSDDMERKHALRPKMTRFHSDEASPLTTPDDSEHIILRSTSSLRGSHPSSSHATNKRYRLVGSSSPSGSRAARRKPSEAPNPGQPSIIDYCFFVREENASGSTASCGYLEDHDLILDEVSSSFEALTSSMNVDVPNSRIDSEDGGSLLWKDSNSIPQHSKTSFSMPDMIKVTFHPSTRRKSIRGRRS
ncbi:hypothetical protein VNI00_005307 [Paramarasmius palmivorus]|uniref:Uncharacterized protein n=1 Tax=Paramarasmius palmivorus TaxID=297713 RepID=A0AAW0DEP6_9AGAR